MLLSDIYCQLIKTKCDRAHDLNVFNVFKSHFNSFITNNKFDKIMPKVRSEKKSRQHNEIQKQGINFNKTLGQHILKNPLVITNMVDKV